MGKLTGNPGKVGLYDPQYEHDACGMGFVVNIKGKQSHQIVQDALTVLANMSHRGARGSDPNTGDGAGITVQMTHTFLQKACTKQGFTLPQPGAYGVGMIFFSADADARQRCQKQFEQVVQGEGLQVLGWRDVPVNSKGLGKAASLSQPHITQVFIGGLDQLPDENSKERKLYITRRVAEKTLSCERFYVCSLSTRTLVYKGMLLAEQLRDYYLDLADPDLESAIALVHSRFSTNTFPSWERAHPYRYVIHNGEINTLRGNVNWMRSRESYLSSKLFDAELSKILPVIDEEGSDTAQFDNVLELLTLSGRSLAHGVMMMIPEPWEKHTLMDATKRAFYEYHSCLMEPWDGPASIGFTDGTRVGAVLDRNGLRPSRYYVTKDDRVIMASEVGVLPIAPENVAHKGRLQPGRMFLVDTAVGRIIGDEELKQQLASEYPYQQWLDDNLLTLADLPPSSVSPKGGETQSPSLWEGLGEGEGYGEGASLPFSLIQLQQAFGYTYEDLRILLKPMAEKGMEAIGSMGDDTPLAVLSDKPQPLYNYFKQLFAQVTNPPLDAIREELVTSTALMLGTEGNLLEPSEADCRLIRLDSPILTNAELAKLRRIDVPGFRAKTLDILYPVQAGEAGLAAALDSLCQQAEAAIADGFNLFILSDRRITYERAAMPALLATAALHHHLIRAGKRTAVSLIVESGEPREVHHFATLLGYGVSAVNPYLALETAAQLVGEDNAEEAIYKMKKAIVKGMVKVMSKMGISTFQSYQGAQIFEAVGLNRSVVDSYFVGTSSRIGGVGLDVLAKEVQMRHQHAFPARQVNGKTLPEGGRYQFREDGEAHLFNPATIHNLQTAVRSNSYDHYQKYAQDVNDQSQRLYTLRGLMQFKFNREPVPLDEVESVERIMRRFKTGAMSYGSISKEAHESLAIAMNRIGGKSNTGEGGEDPARYKLDENGDSRNSAIKQVASGRFGVTSQYLTEAKEIQIKMAQGAKPGEGGQLPGHKVYPWIAEVRHATPGVGLISPPPHHDIYSIEDLAQLIYDLKNANPQARINVKLVSEVGVGTIAAGVAKGHADVILISGHDGGTGASPQTSIKHAGLPWELGLAETQQTLRLNGLRSRVVLETDGQLKTGRDVVIAALLGAEEFGFATAPLVALGCIMMRVCHLDTCPVGVATQNPELRKRFMGDPAHVVNFMRFLAEDVRQLMAQLGFRRFEEMVGQTERLEMRPVVAHWKSQGLDLSPILCQPEWHGEDTGHSEPDGRYQQTEQQHRLEETLDFRTLLRLCQPALEEGKPVRATLPIHNQNRTVGTMVGSEVTRRFGAEGLPEDTIRLRFQGSAGQSFGAFVPPGVTLVLEGDANDYVGKGLSGGKIIVSPPPGATFVPSQNIIIGNVAFYGATGGEAYIQGRAGERFCVRNSGVTAVVEGVGDHGCEYMTGGRVIVLGRTGRNFAAGMSGGVAYVLDEDGDFAGRCNQEMVSLERLVDHDEELVVKQIIRRHAQATHSERAQQVLVHWHEMKQLVVKVVPTDYLRMQMAIQQAEASGLRGEAAVLAAFETSKRQKVIG
ncbi:MAG: glutamate synthase large subunit [Ardenticatenaceae bacterium]|nr:glutamate synthase large subunit [Ardenticatenaceae bacterium]